MSAPSLSTMEADLRKHVAELCGLRHGVENYDELEKRGKLIEETFLSGGFPVRNQYLDFRKRRFRNIVATVAGARDDLPPLLVGAHYDGNRSTPGADDNASGVAVLLELAMRFQEVVPKRRVDLVAFTLEEPQECTHRIQRGSRFFAREAAKEGLKYEGVVILECVGFTGEIQKGAALSRLFGMNMPGTGDFLAVVANRQSKRFMELFLQSAHRSVPFLKTAGYAAPLQGYLLPQLRFSDHASFWERGFPGIMLNDTVMFRNPHYHTAGDTPDTLDYRFLAKVTIAVTEFVTGFE